MIFAHRFYLSHLLRRVEACLPVQLACTLLQRVQLLTFVALAADIFYA